jgi:hypothetical protein
VVARCEKPANTNSAVDNCTAGEDSNTDTITLAA